MLRVLMLAPTPFFSDRGCHVRIYEEARALMALGVEIEVLTYPIGSDPPGITVHRVGALPGYERTEAGPAWPRLFLDARLLKEAHRRVARRRPDLIHAHLHEGGLIARALKFRYRLPVVFDYQGSLMGESIQHGFIREGSALAWLFERVERWIEEGADTIIASADSTRPVPRAGLPLVETVVDGVDGERFRPGSPDEELKRGLKLPPGTPVAVFLGVFSQYQGTDLLVEAARLLRDQGMAVHFLMMGYPDAWVRELARARGVADMMTFTGRLDYFAAAEYLRLGDLAVAPKLGRTESNGKVLNYMACGLATAAFDLPVNRELMGDCALYMTPGEDRAGDARAVAEAVARLVREPELRRSLGESGRRRAVESFGFERQARKIMDLYQRALDGR